MAEDKTGIQLSDEKIESLELGLQKVEGIPGCAVVSMKGYIDTYNAPHFQRQVDKAVQAGYSRLVFDFSGITYISSSGIGAFTHFLKEVRPRGGDLVLVGMVGRVYEVFKSEYEKADTVLKAFMGMIERYVAWPNSVLARCFTDSFSTILDGLHREQVLLVEALRRKEQRIGELEAAEWAELEEL